MSTLLTVREDLATALRDALGDEYNVYSYPAELIALPAVVIVPDEPWWEVSSFGASPTSRVRVNFEVQILTPRTEVEMGFIDLESVALLVAIATLSVPTMAWRDLGQPTTVEVNEIQALKTGISISGLI